MATRQRKHYSAEFKREAVNLLEESTKTTAQLARELGVKRTQLYQWRDELAEHGDAAFPGHGNRQKKQTKDETSALKKQLRQLKEENEILKKAAIYFARASQ